MTKPFAQRRRQQFLTEPYFEHIAGCLASERDHWREALQGVGDTEQEQRMLARMTHADSAYDLFTLQYTAGAALEQLRTELGDVIEAYERFQRALAEYEQIPRIAPLGLRRLGDYERCMQLIGLCYLLHRRDLLPRIAALQDPGYAGEDALYEELLDYALPDRVDTDAMFHLKPYGPLLHAMFADTDEESIEDINKYVHSWYASFKYTPWHDGHLRINGTDGDYFGYWAFEAGAVALLCDIDDSSIAHVVYPKDLVAWAREHKHLSDDSQGTALRLRCEAGEPCPRAGFWFTPAKASSRRLFALGELMPDVGSKSWATIWQWDERQDP